MIRDKIIAIDFDGTIVEHEFPEIGPLREHAKEAINTIAKHNRVCIWTCRNGDYAVKACKFLNENEIPFDFFNASPIDYINAGCRKIIADCYIDDRNLFGHVNWKEIEQYFLNNDNL